VSTTIAVNGASGSVHAMDDGRDLFVFRWRGREDESRSGPNVLSRLRRAA